MSIIFCFVFVLINFYRVNGIQTCPPSNEDIEKAMDIAHIPGLATMVVNKKDILYERAFGFQTPSTISTQQPIHLETSIFALASISKTLIAFSAMQLVESGQLDLNEDINTYLSPLPKLVHPVHVNATITVQNVLSHMTSIGPNLDDELKETYLPGDTFLQTNLTNVIYRYVSKRENWLPDVPGTKASYSNIGAALGALIVERIAKISFEEYVHERILSPIGIDRKDAGYRLSDFQTRQKDLIGHYIFNASYLESYQMLVPQLNVSLAANGSDWLYVPHFSLSDYPSGLLRMSARSLSLFLRVFLNDGKPLLTKTSSMDTMLRVYGRTGPQPTGMAEYGLIWTWLEYDQQRWIGHRGAVPGFTNAMMANKNRTIGVIMLSTGDLTNGDAQAMDVYKTVMDVMSQLFDCYETNGYLKLHISNYLFFFSIFFIIERFTHQ